MLSDTTKEITKTIIGTILFLILICIVPTGWIYDIGLSTGSKQGQWADNTVSIITNNNDIKEAYRHNTPSTINGGKFIACPLLQLRSKELKGTHTVRKRGRHHSYNISEYWTMPYPSSIFQNIIAYCLAEGLYNRYYLLKLNDGTYLCVYLDNYLLLRNILLGNKYQTGHIRHAQSYEQTMLKKMGDNYNVNTFYILDMYRKGKQPGYIDMILRLLFGCVVVYILCILDGKYKLIKRLRFSRK